MDDYLLIFYKTLTACFIFILFSLALLD